MTPEETQALLERLRAQVQVGMFAMDNPVAFGECLDAIEHLLRSRDAMAEALRSARDYVSDVSEGRGPTLAAPSVIDMAKEDLARIDAALNQPLMGEELLTWLRATSEIAEAPGTDPAAFMALVGKGARGFADRMSNAKGDAVCPVCGVTPTFSPGACSLECLAKSREDDAVEAVDPLVAKLRDRFFTILGARVLNETLLGYILEAATECAEVAAIEAMRAAQPETVTDAMMMAGATAYHAGVKEAEKERAKLGLNTLGTRFPVSWLDRVYLAMRAAHVTAQQGRGGEGK